MDTKSKRRAAERVRRAVTKMLKGSGYVRGKNTFWVRPRDHVIEFVHLHLFSWDQGSAGFLAEARSIRPPVLNLYASHWCQSEVNNGGFHQFFYNTTGVLAPEAVEGFRAIGLLEWSALLAEAMAYFGTPYPREREARLNRLPQADGRKRAQWDPFTELDAKFYSSGDGERRRFESAADSYAQAAA